MDWKVVAAAPLVIENQLPVRGTYLIWETPRVCHTACSLATQWNEPFTRMLCGTCQVSYFRHPCTCQQLIFLACTSRTQATGKSIHVIRFTVLQQDGSNMLMRQSGSIESGERVHIYSADMRRTISLQFYPDGYDLVEPQPVLVSEGFSSHQAGVQGRQKLPDKFHVARAGSEPQEIFLDRDIDMEAWQMNDKVGTEWYTADVSLSGQSQQFHNTSVTALNSQLLTVQHQARCISACCDQKTV